MLGKVQIRICRLYKKIQISLLEQYEHGTYMIVD